MSQSLALSHAYARIFLGPICPPLLDCQLDPSMPDIDPQALTEVIAGVIHRTYGNDIRWHNWPNSGQSSLGNMITLCPWSQQPMSIIFIIAWANLNHKDIKKDNPNKIFMLECFLI